MPEPKNFWHVEVSTRLGARNKSHRLLVRLEDKPRTRSQAIRDCGYKTVTKATQRCTAENRFGVRCGRYTGTEDALCIQHSSAPGGGRAATGFVLAIGWEQGGPIVTETCASFEEAMDGWQAYTSAPCRPFYCQVLQQVARKNQVETASGKAVNGDDSPPGGRCAAESVEVGARNRAVHRGGSV